MITIDNVKKLVKIKLKNQPSVYGLVDVLAANGYWVKLDEVDDKNNVEIIIKED